MRRLTLSTALAGPRTGPSRVLVGVDFDEPSLAAARWVAHHFARDAQIVLVHVIPVPSGPPFLLRYLRAPGALFEQLAPPLRGGLQGLAGVLGAERTRAELRAGDPAEQLAAAAAAIGADLVCVGRPREWADTAKHGRNTVDRLLRRLRIPLVQPAGELRAPPAHLLAAVDGGDASIALLATAWSHAARLEARLTSLHVVDETVRRYARSALQACEACTLGAAVGADAGDVEDAIRGVALEWLRRALERAGARAERSEVDVRAGDPGGEILHAARRADADLIVVGRSGHDAVSAGDVGSATRMLLRAAPCPVLVLPPASVPAHPGDPSGRTRERESASAPAKRDRAVPAWRVSEGLDSPPAARSGAA
jgi:nucleotide-binding universal stress UspA family protein